MAYSLVATELLQDKIDMHIHFPIFIPREMRIGNFGNLDKLALIVHWSIEKLLSQYTVKSFVQSPNHRTSTDAQAAHRSQGLPPAVSRS